jgi:undecaprenyl-diphosphatase
MLVADSRPQRRGRGDATAADGLALGVAQAAALAPGVSRNGVTLAAARWRRFSRDQANLLSRTIALPIIVGAVALKGARLRRRGATASLRRSMAVGAVASFASTLASQRLIRLVERDRALWPYAAYRAVLAAAVLIKLRRRPAPQESRLPERGWEG